MRRNDGTGNKDPDHTLDCIGLYCPEPIFRIRGVIDKIAVGDTLGVLANDPAAEEDVLRWAKRTGNKVLTVEKEGGKIYFLIEKT